MLKAKRGKQTIELLPELLYDECERTFDDIVNSFVIK